MKSDAEVALKLWVKDTDTGRSINMPTKVEFVPTEILLGDGNAEAGRDVFMRLSEGEYNAVVLGTTASVRIKCNQDDESIGQALKACENLAQAAIKDYQPTMEKVLKKLVEGRK